MISYDMPFEDYKGAEGCNASTLKTLVKDDYARVLIPREATDAMRFGSAAHIVLLEPELIKKEIVVKPKFPKGGKGVTADVKAENIRLENEFFALHGDNWIEQDELDQVMGMCKALRIAGSDAELLLSHDEFKTEVSVFGEVDGVPAKCRFDGLILSAGVGFDYKTSRTANPREFIWDARKMGYDLQAAWYIDTMASIGHTIDQFIFLVQEKTAPYLCSVIGFAADGEFVQEGRDKYRAALEKYRAYHDHGVKGYDGMMVDGDSL